MDPNQTETLELIAQIRSGSRRAWSRLAERELPPLTKYARGRLPSWARATNDTQDLIQDVFVRTLPRLTMWEHAGPGALRAFLRKAVANQIVDEVRKARRRSGSPAALEGLADRAPSPLARTIRKEQVGRLRAAVSLLSASDRKLLAARFGSDRRYADIAVLLGRPSANAARVAVERAIDRAAKIMDENSAAATRAGAASSAWRGRRSTRA